MKVLKLDSVVRDIVRIKKCRHFAKDQAEYMQAHIKSC